MEKDLPVFVKFGKVFHSIVGAGGGVKSRNMEGHNFAPSTQGHDTDRIFYVNPLVDLFFK